MHTVFSYDLRNEAVQRRQEVETRIEQILQPRRHVRRLSTYYIVYVESQADWDTLLNNMTGLARELSGQFMFVMSPPIEGGRYNGILQRGEWDDINAITNM